MSNLYDYLNENSQFQSFLQNKKSYEENIADAKGTALASLGENLPLAVEVGSRVVEGIKALQSATAGESSVGDLVSKAASVVGENIASKVGSVVGENLASKLPSLPSLSATSSEASAMTSNLGDSLAGRLAARAFEQDPEDIGSFIGNNQSLVESAQAIFRGGAQAGEGAIASVGENLATKVSGIASDIGEQVATKAASVAGEAAATGEAVGAAAGEAVGAGLGAVASTAASVLGPVGIVAGLGLSIYDIVEAFEKPTFIAKAAKPVFVAGL
jgi:hypothetical protein